MDFEEDIRQMILKNLPHNPLDDGELQAKSALDLLIIYCNWRRRLVPAKPRIVHQSSALSANPLASDPRCKPEFDRIIGLLETGVDVTPHLSRAIRYGYVGTSQAKLPNKKSRQDLDLFLNDWGVHHLHLATNMEADGFVERADFLLFAVFKVDDVYLIDILPHNDPDLWVREHTIQVIVHEWPSIGVVMELAGFQGPLTALDEQGTRRPFTEQDRKALRKSHLFGLIEVDGKLYSPAGGLTTAGGSTLCTEFADDVFRRMKPFEAQLRSSPQYISEMLSANGVAPPDVPDLHFAFFESGGYGVVEQQTGFRFILRE